MDYQVSARLFPFYLCFETPTHSFPTHLCCRVQRDVRKAVTRRNVDAVHVQDLERCLASFQLDAPPPFHWPRASREFSLLFEQRGGRENECADHPGEDDQIDYDVGTDTRVRRTGTYTPTHFRTRARTYTRTLTSPPQVWNLGMNLRSGVGFRRNGSSSVSCIELGRSACST